MEAGWWVDETESYAKWIFIIDCKTRAIVNKTRYNKAYNITTY